jgi:uncharacterized BrkB/YihY/UPF0761 family membrane protein
LEGCPSPHLEEHREDRVIVVAAGVTFYSVLALFPAIAALVALYGLFADPTTITSHLDSIAGLVPVGTKHHFGASHKFGSGRSTSDMPRPSRGRSPTHRAKFH